MLRNVERFVMSYTAMKIEYNSQIESSNFARELCAIRDITYYHAICWSIIALCYGPKSFLSYKAKAKTNIQLKHLVQLQHFKHLNRCVNAESRLLFDEKLK